MREAQANCHPLAFHVNIVEVLLDLFRQWQLNIFSLLFFLVVFGVKGRGRGGGGRKSKGNLDNNELKNNTDNL